MKPGSMAMLNMLQKPPKKIKPPKAQPNPSLQMGPGAKSKPVNDPTDPEQLLESERTPLGAGPSARIPIKTMLPKVPYKTKG